MFWILGIVLCNLVGCASRMHSHRTQLVGSPFNRWNWNQCKCTESNNSSAEVVRQSHGVAKTIHRHHTRFWRREMVQLDLYTLKTNTFHSRISRILRRLVSKLIKVIEFNVTITFFWTMATITSMMFGLRAETVKLYCLMLCSEFYFPTFFPFWKLHSWMEMRTTWKR